MDPYSQATIIAEGHGFRARRVLLDSEHIVPWHRKTASTTTLFANSDGLAVQIKRPPFRNELKRGEHYTVPRDVELTVYSLGESASVCTVFEYGESLLASPATPPTLAYVVNRSREPSPKTSTPAPTVAADYGSFTAGFSRMDVIAASSDLRLILQGHGANECVPWHSHDHIADTFFCASGTVRVATRSPNLAYQLSPGDTCQVKPGVPHFVSGMDGCACEILILQGVGRYNYVAR